MIKLDNDFFIKTEQFDYSAWVYVDGKNPKTKAPTRRAKIIGYYPNVLSCLEAIKDYKVHNAMGNDIEGLENAISIIRRVHEEFLTSLKKVEFEK